MAEEGKASLNLEIHDRERVAPGRGKGRKQREE